MNIPPLFHSPVPGELENYIRGQEAEATGEPTPLNTFMAKGVERIAYRLLHHGCDEELKSWTYALHAYCRKYNEPAPDVLLRLTFAALGCREHAPAPAVSRALGLVDDVRKMPAFLEAAAMDGEADAADEPLSVNALATRMSVTRDTVRHWRDHPRYQSRRAFAEMACRYWRERQL